MDPVVNYDETYKNLENEICKFMLMDNYNMTHKESTAVAKVIKEEYGSDRVKDFYKFLFMHKYHTQCDLITRSRLHHNRTKICEYMEKYYVNIDALNIEITKELMDNINNKY